MSGLFLGDHKLDPVDLDAYFERVHYSGPRRATWSTLEELQRLHPAAVPFETIDVILGLEIDLSSEAVDAKLIGARRGGYCFEQNLLFLRVLRTLGFQADPLIARSRWRRPIDELVARTHMAVRVELDNEYWLVDVGFGACMITSPIRMDARGSQRTRHEPVRMTPVGGELRLERRLGNEWVALYDVVLTPQETVDLVAANWLISAHPASSFRKHLVVSRTTDGVRYVLVDARLTVRRGAAAEHTKLDADDLEECLRADFGLSVKDEWHPLLKMLASRSRQSAL